MKTIYSWGDSHVCMFDEKYRTTPKPEGEVKVVFAERSHHYVYTAYDIESHDEFIREHLASIGLQEHDEMWFMFGEIDVRFHLFYHHQKLQVPLDEMIDTVVTKYITYVKKLRDELGYDIHVVSIVPPQPVPGPYPYDPTYQIKDWIRGNGNSLEHRIYITKELNRKYEIECEKNGIPFRNIYPYLVNPETECNIPEMTRDGMHYNYLGDFLIELFNLDEGL